MTVRTEIKDQIAVVTLDRPPVNALDAATFRALTETFRGFARSQSAHVAILTAQGELAIAQRLAGKSPIGLRLAKESLNRVEDLPLRQGYRTEQDYTLRVQRFEDSAEARRAFLEKRDPRWNWR